MEIGENKVVAVSYKLESGKPGEAKAFVEETGADHPLTFLFGSGQLIPDFEKNLSGLSAGSSFKFDIDAANAYGVVEEDALVNVSTEMFKVNGVIDFDVLRTGNIIPLLDKEGNQLTARIVSIDGENVMLDFNHPLAGHDLHFDGKVISVREASAEEISHGHAHDGHTHHH